MISTTGDRISDNRLQSQNSTTEPTVRITHKWRQINKSWKKKEKKNKHFICCYSYFMKAVFKQDPLYLFS